MCHWSPRMLMLSRTHRVEVQEALSWPWQQAALAPPHFPAEKTEVQLSIKVIINNGLRQDTNLNLTIKIQRQSCSSLTSHSLQVQVQVQC